MFTVYACTVSPATVDRMVALPVLTALAGAAKDAGARLALFGHTHIQHLEERGGITLLNPGTAGRFGHSGYAVVEIKDGAFSCRLETDTE